MTQQKLTIGRAKDWVQLNSDKINRHGAIFGATGTGKTVTLKVLAEQLSAVGVPVFLADVKGDLASLCLPAAVDEKIAARLEQLQLLDYEPQSFPVEFLDVYGQSGCALRSTVSEMGPVLLSRILGLNAIQEGVLNICFSVADENRMLLVDIKDLRAMLNYIDENKNELRARYGNISSSSVGAILRALLVVEEQGGDRFFGEPSFEIEDLLRTAPDGRGIISILASDQLLLSPMLYATFLLWLLTELYQTLPEVGDQEYPRIAFFFDEAHLLFRDIPPYLSQQIEQMVRLSRSKGIGIYFITQSPSDIPEIILSQCGNKIQHALRAYTPKDQLAIRKMAQNFCQDGSFSVEEAITTLAVGEALVSVLDENGAPTPVVRTMIFPPRSQMAAIDPLSRMQLLNQSALLEKYAQAIDRESAYELLAAEKEKTIKEQEEQRLVQEQEKQNQLAEREAQKQQLAEQKRQEAQLERAQRAAERLAEAEARRKAREAAKPSGAEKFANQVVGSIGREFGRQITRSFLGIFKK
ncbi:MAG: helicase HerA-like domain-containing protein [Ndongobacter sp.]|nr:helicase HerA-like domain-containing protein [Ndongobacter sp.]